MNPKNTQSSAMKISFSPKSKRGEDTADLHLCGAHRIATDLQTRTSSGPTVCVLYHMIM